MSALLASFVTGAGLGTFFILVWRRCVDKFCPPQFWNSLYRVTRELMQVEDTVGLLRLYRKLFSGVARYFSGNIIGLVIGLLPVVLLLYFVSPAVDAYRNRDINMVEVFPANIATLTRNSAPLDSRSDTARTLYEVERTAEVMLTVNSTRIIMDNLQKKTGICWSYWYCALFETLGFDVIETGTALTYLSSYIVVRPDHGTDSLFWPILNDIESVFMFTFFITNIVVFVGDKRRSS